MKIEQRVILAVTALDCPRCGVQDNLPRDTQAIINSGAEGVLVTLQCPNCNDLVQVYAAGETYATLLVKKP